MNSTVTPEDFERLILRLETRFPKVVDWEMLFVKNTFSVDIFRKILRVVRKNISNKHVVIQCPYTIMPYVVLSYLYSFGFKGSGRRMSFEDIYNLYWVWETNDDFNGLAPRDMRSDKYMSASIFFVVINDIISNTVKTRRALFSVLNNQDRHDSYTVLMSSGLNSFDWEVLGSEEVVKTFICINITNINNIQIKEASTLAKFAPHVVKSAGEVLNKSKIDSDAYGNTFRYDDNF